MATLGDGETGVPAGQQGISNRPGDEAAVATVQEENDDEFDENDEEDDSDEDDFEEDEDERTDPESEPDKPA